ncbi:hypothetical protein Agub_g2766 [Astrephomene gubernaculifera]|uniref:AB hydrolase-1 domain-containing protein n=1 Tax=Astrephomene gubernaculifera TaxID=47775 RepID=A0AAD3DHJ5_9CHLO|nr:hypothetical protein Agub_g2766 [Astrephomene gubernaculifera]
MLLYSQNTKLVPTSWTGGSRNIRVRENARTVSALAVAHSKATTYVPPGLSEVVEPEALKLATSLRRVPITIPSMPGSPEIATAFVGPTAEELSRYPRNVPAFVLLPGFDSSCVEFRRLYPLLAAVAPTYAVDLVGCGFSDSSLFLREPSRTLTPDHKTDHLAAFLRTTLSGAAEGEQQGEGEEGKQQQPAGAVGGAAAVGQGAAGSAGGPAAADESSSAPGGSSGARSSGGCGGRRVVLVGASLGGAVAVAFAVAYPQLVHSLVLVDAQGFLQGLGPLPFAPRPLLQAGVALLGSQWLRRAVNKMAYYDKPRFVTPEAVLLSSLHTQQPGWAEANIAFMRSGGFAVKESISKVPQEALVMWGRNDEILDPAFAERFRSTLPYCRRPVAWIERCGHLPHLEAPEQAAAHILEFVGLAKEASTDNNINNRTTEGNEMRGN